MFSVMLYQQSKFERPFFLGNMTTTQATCSLPPNSFFENANKRFLFTMKNRTPYTFLLDGSCKECGIIETALQELRPGTNESPTEIYIRGYKKSYALYGVTYTVHFRILDEQQRDTNSRLQILLAVGEKLTDNYFGWYIYIGKDGILSPQQWKATLDNKNDYNHNKTSCEEKVLNIGGQYTLRATVPKLSIEIEMSTDNESHSTPTMIIRSITL